MASTVREFLLWTWSRWIRRCFQLFLWIIRSNWMEKDGAQRAGRTSLKCCGLENCQQTESSLFPSSSSERRQRFIEDASDDAACVLILMNQKKPVVSSSFSSSCLNCFSHLNSGHRCSVMFIVFALVQRVNVVEFQLFFLCYSGMRRDSTCLTWSATTSTSWRKTISASDMWTQTSSEWVFLFVCVCCLFGPF